MHTHPHITNPTRTHTHTSQNKLKQPQYKIHTKWNTVEPRFTNLIRSWRPFITRNVRKPKLLWSHGVLFNNVLKIHKTQWNSREGTANSSRDVYWANFTQQLTLSRRYSQLVANHCCRLACSLLDTPFVTRDSFFFRKICSWTDLFVMRGVREQRFHCSHKIVKYPHYKVTLMYMVLLSPRTKFLFLQLPPWRWQKHVGGRYVLKLHS
jgi:hypothetical protein